MKYCDHCMCIFVILLYDVPLLIVFILLLAVLKVFFFVQKQGCANSCVSCSWYCFDRG